jgi:sortase A
MSIPAIDLNSSIVDVSPIETVSPSGEVNSIWDAAAYAVGHFETSGNPGGGRNIVLAGHNNTLGEVFRDLNQLNLGDEVILFTEEQTFSYTIQKKYIIPFMANEEEGNLRLQSYSAPQNSEMVTLISCWPYATNASRIILIAVPNHGGDSLVH